MNANSLKDTVSNAQKTVVDSVEHITDKVAQVGKNARDTAAEVLDDAKDLGQSAARKLKAQVAEAAAAAEDRLDDLSDVAQSRASAARAKLADGGDRLANALHNAADGTRAASGRVVNAVAGTVSDVADHLRVDSVSDLVASTKAYARRNPGTVAAGAAVIGFAVAHLLRRNRGPRA